MSGEPSSAVELRGLTKHFGGVLANDGVNLHVRTGSIHGVVGENGAGKSTAMNLLYGIFPPDAGSIFVHGQERVWSSPADAIAAGIGMVHQHFMLAGPYSALDNILLGAEPVRFGLIERKKARAELERLARQYELPVDLSQPIEELPVGVQQRVEILKLLYRKARILILDEPTGVLTPQETRVLFQHLNQLRAEGKTILLITHKLKEVMAVTDRVTVLRGGKVTGELATAQTNPQDLANLMVGRKVVLNIAVPAAERRSETALAVTGLSLAGATGSGHKLSDVHLSVNAGEIVGIAGVEGNGQSELIEAILHPRDSRNRISGTIHVFGNNVISWPASKIRELGVAVIPGDRQRDGLLLERSLAENFLLGRQRSADFSRSGFLLLSKLQSAAATAIEEYDVRPRELSVPAGKLSGGNQQKLIVGREFQRKPRLLIASQPTRGVDVGAIEFIHQRIVQARDGGAGVLLVSFELDEILTLSDRILVMYEGRIVAEFRRGEVTEQDLGLKMAGG